jgi:hypothetical protein
MDHDVHPSIAGQLASGSVPFGMVCLLTCWWFPFGCLVGSVGVACGVFGWFAREQRIRAVVGTLLAGGGMSTGLLLAADDWRRMFGL